MNGGIDDKDLLDSVSEGSEEAFDYIYLRYAPAVEAYAGALLKNREDAEDICHNIFLRLWENRGSLSGIKSLKAYLFTAVKNAVFDVWKKNTHVSSGSCISESVLKDLPCDDLEGKIEVNELLRLIDIAVSAMPQERRTVFLLSRTKQMTNREIAEYLGVSVKTVEYHISKSLSRLREIMKIIVFFLN